MKYIFTGNLYLYFCLRVFFIVALKISNRNLIPIVYSLFYMYEYISLNELKWKNDRINF